MYAVQRFFVHASGWLTGPAAMVAVVDVFRANFREASYAGLAATTMFCYWMAFHERRDIRRAK